VNVNYCDRCGGEMVSTSTIDQRFIAMQDEGSIPEARRLWTTDLPSGIGVPVTLVGRKSVLLHVCGPCGQSLLNWLATP
jgi:hypothetical protein